MLLKSVVKNTYIFRKDFELLVLTVSLAFMEKNDYDFLFHLCIPLT